MKQVNNYSREYFRKEVLWKIVDQKWFVKKTQIDFLNEKTKKWLFSLIKKVYNVKLGIPKSIFWEKYVIYAWYIAEVLESSWDETNKRLAHILHEGNRRLMEIHIEKWLDPQKIKRLKSIWFLHEDIRRLLDNYDWDNNVIHYLQTHYDTLFIILWDVKYIKKIVLMFQGKEKLERIKEKWSLLQERIDFTGYHLSQIVVWGEREEKLKYFEDEKKLEKLKDAWFTGYHLSQIVRNKWREEKLKYFEDEKKLEKLKDAWFTGSHLSQIVVWGEREEKLKYFEDEKKLEKLKDAWFTGSHLSQIVVWGEREEKINFTLVHCKKILTYIAANKYCIWIRKKNWRDFVESITLED